MATPWWEFCAVEMLIFMVVWACAAQMKPKLKTRPANNLLNFMLSPAFNLNNFRKGHYALCGTFTASGFSRI